MILIVVVVLAFLNLNFKDEFSHKSKDHDILLNKLIRENAHFNPYKAKSSSANKTLNNSSGKQKQFYFIDHQEPSSSVVKCPNGIEVKTANAKHERPDFEVFLNGVFAVDKKESFHVVYAMESEPHSG